MRILSFEELRTEDIKNSYYSEYVDMKSREVYKMLEQVTQSTCDKAVDILNKINNQGIVSIDKNLLCYDIQDRDGIKRLSLASMSTSESLFFIATLANSLNRKVILSKDIYQLTKKTLRTFYNIFRDSENIILVFEDEYDALYYKKNLMEVVK